MEGEEYDTRVLVRHNFSLAMITIYDVFVLRVTASKDRAKLEIDPKIKTRFGGHGLKDCFRVTEHPAVALKVKHSALFILV